MADKCIVREGRIVEPCEDLNNQCEAGNPPPGARRGIWEWRYFNTNTHKPSRAFFGAKTTHSPKGMAFNFCPWCGERIDAPFNSQHYTPVPDVPAGVLGTLKDQP